MGAGGLLESESVSEREPGAASSPHPSGGGARSGAPSPASCAAGRGAAAMAEAVAPNILWVLSATRVSVLQRALRRR